MFTSVAPFFSLFDWKKNIFLKRNKKTSFETLVSSNNKRNMIVITREDFINFT